jgi:hypothetical protein
MLATATFVEAPVALKGDEAQFLSVRMAAGKATVIFIISS